MADLDEIYDIFPRLKERKKQKAGTLSGGEQQMLAIARAMMAKPKIILLDEPSMGLAPIIVKEVFEIIKKLNESGITIVLVEQNAKLALSIADRGYVLETGKIILSGTGEELLNNENVKSLFRFINIEQFLIFILEIAFVFILVMILFKNLSHLK